MTLNLLLFAASNINSLRLLVSSGQLPLAQTGFMEFLNSLKTVSNVSKYLLKALSKLFRMTANLEYKEYSSGMENGQKVNSDSRNSILEKK